MAARLMIHYGADATESFNGLHARTYRKPAHFGISTISSVIPRGIGSPCFFRLAMYP